MRLFSMVEAYLNGEATSAEVKEKKKVRTVVMGRLKAYRISSFFPSIHHNRIALINIAETLEVS